MSVRPYVRTYVRPSVRPHKVSSISMKFNVGKGRRVMYDSMLYDPLQGQGHEPLKVGHSTIFGLANDHGFLN